MEKNSVAMPKVSLMLNDGKEEQGEVNSKAVEPWAWPVNSEPAVLLTRALETTRGVSHCPEGSLPSEGED